jgi:hypothetical protein
VFATLCVAHVLRVVAHDGCVQIALLPSLLPRLDYAVNISSFRRNIGGAATVSSKFNLRIGALTALSLASTLAAAGPEQSTVSGTGAPPGGTGAAPGAATPPSGSGGGVSVRYVVAESDLVVVLTGMAVDMLRFNKEGKITEHRGYWQIASNPITGAIASPHGCATP